LLKCSTVNVFQSEEGIIEVFLPDVFKGKIIVYSSYARSDVCFAAYMDNAFTNPLRDYSRSSSVSSLVLINAAVTLGARV